MAEAFSAAKNLAQVKILPPVDRHDFGVHRSFSMGKKSALKTKPHAPVAPALQRTFIQEWRKTRGLSQTDLGAAVGLSTATISQIENAKTGYSQAHLEAIAQVLKVHPIDLLVCDPVQYPKGIWPTVSAILA